MVIREDMTIVAGEELTIKPDDILIVQSENMSKRKPLKVRGRNNK
jgi:hypothetical protein